MKIKDFRGFLVQGAVVTALAMSVGMSVTDAAAEQGPRGNDGDTGATGARGDAGLPGVDGADG